MRVPARLQILDLCHLVDPAGDHALDCRPGAHHPLEPFNKGSLREVTMRQDSRTKLGSPNPAYMPPSGPMNIKRRGYTTNPEAKPNDGVLEAKRVTTVTAAE